MEIEIFRFGSNGNGKVVYAKTLEDGSVAIGLFNRSEKEATLFRHVGALGFPAHRFQPHQNARTIYGDNKIWESLRKNSKQK